MTQQFGYDPAPPGKYPLTKALVDSDLDGIVCAAILKTVYPEIQIILGDPVSLQQGKYDKVVDKETVIADLRYLPGCGLYLDHHFGNKPSNNDFPGRWRDVQSAARVVYEYFSEAADLTKFADVVVDVDKQDSGEITLDEVRQPSLVIRLGLAIKRDDQKFNQHLIDLFVKQDLSSLEQDGQVQALLQAEEINRDQVIVYIDQHTEITDNLALVDLTEFPGELTHSYYIVSRFPQVDAVVLFKSDRQQTRVNFYRNNFKAGGRQYDLLAVATALNPEASGGHKYACGCILPKTMSKDQAKTFIREQLRQQAEQI